MKRLLLSLSMALLVLTMEASAQVTRGSAAEASPFVMRGQSAPQSGTPLFWSGGIFGHPIGTGSGPNVFGHPIGTSPFVYNRGFENGGRPRHHHRRNGYGLAVPYAYSPYPYYPLDWDSGSYTMGPENSAQPQVIYVLPQNGIPAQTQAAPQPAPTERATEAPTPQQQPSSAEPQEPTTLVFRDGRTKEISNYAIVGSRLLVFSVPKQEFALADLDIPATVKVNDDRGVTFRVPETPAH